MQTKSHHKSYLLKPGDVPVTYMDINDLIKAMSVESDTPIEVGIQRFAECYKKYRCSGNFLGKR